MRLKERIGRIGRSFVAGLAAFGLASAPAVASAPTTTAAAPRPAIWLLEDEDTRIYLFGTTHIFERGLVWRSARLEEVIREADELVMETADEDELSDEDFAATMFMAKPVPVLSRVSQDRRARLQAVIDASGLPREMWDQLQTWAVGFMVMAVRMMEGMTEEEREAADPFAAMLSGAEQELAEDFRRAGKPISAVESSRQQMDMFRTLPRAAQRAFLESTLDEDGGEGDEGGEVNWLSGNVEGIAREMEALPAELYDILLTRRNRNWTEWLAARLDRPGTVLFAVGAGHLAGRDSVQAMLAARGLTARRID